MALDRPTQPARAAARDYRDRFGRLPTMTELADAVQVNRATAGYALRDIKAGRTGRYYVEAVSTANAETTETAEATETAEIAGAATDVGRQERRGRERRAVAVARQPDDTDAAALPAGAHAVDPRAGRPRPRDDQARGQVADTGRHGHRIEVHSRGAHTTTPAPRNDTTRNRQASSRSDRKDTVAEDDPTAAPPAEVSIARARVALTVLSAHRAEQDKRRATEQTRTEQLNRWHHDDHHDRTTTTRASTRAGRAHHGEGHAR